MLPIGPLMIEHRLIERVIALMAAELVRIKATGKADPSRITTIVDFIKTYADHFHHGKEENILFSELGRKALSDEHRRILDELIAEHALGRTTTQRLVEATARYVGGDAGALAEIAEAMAVIVEFYPRHIDKEDRHFFMPVMAYFSEQEKADMLKQGYAFDQTLIHEKYKEMIVNAEKAAE